MDLGENGISIEVHCDAGEIMPKMGIKAQIGISGAFRRKVINGEDKDMTYVECVPISRPIGDSHTAATSGYAGEIQALPHGFDTALFLKSVSSGFILGNENVDIQTGVRNDSSSFVEHAHAIAPSTSGRRLNIPPDSNREELNLSRR